MKRDFYFLSHSHSVPSAGCAAKKHSPEQAAVQMKVQKLTPKQHQN